MFLLASEQNWAWVTIRNLKEFILSLISVSSNIILYSVVSNRLH